ncbi:extracellular solute-binding protein [Kineosporia babensis]|uniref:Extracellular solute-binding protein n=1 Tax=Kineosporia babensis TaxID=499548 RepID=A0A9X1SWD2_9ACTN|nr:extracellular solute-binding protein [Kineosporia babensis]MCD5314636.1 extracellular solute-binding protein [Kineosporia babensis]
MPLRILGRAFDGFDRAFTKQLQNLDVEHELVDILELERRVVHTRAPEADVLLLITDWLPALIEAGRLLPIETTSIQGWPDAYAPALRQLQQGPDGRTYGVAYHDGPMLFLYRTDLYRDPQEQAGFRERFGYELENPLDWNQFMDQAIWFNRPEKGLYGTVQAGFPDEHNPVYDFLTQLWSRGGDLIVGGRSGLDSAPALETVAFFHDLWHISQVVNPAAAQWDSVESGQRFAAGEAAMMVNWAGFASPHDGCAPVPGATTMNAYWVLAIPSDAPDPQQSQALIRKLATPEMDVVTALSGGSATRRDSWANPRVRSSAPYYEVLETAHRNSRSVPSDPRWPRMAGIVNELMRGLIADRKGFESLQDAHEKLNRLLT